MRTVWKYDVHPGRFDVEMPLGAEILEVQCQHDDPVMWVLVDGDPKTEVRTFVTAGTGHELPAMTRLQHIGTWQQNDLVWHLFEMGR
jgi:hypothetical protein